MGDYRVMKKIGHVLLASTAFAGLALSPAALFAAGPDKGHDDVEVYHKEKMDKAAEEAQKLTPAAGEETGEVLEDEAEEAGKHENPAMEDEEHHQEDKPKS